jgi:hypothetical protein
MPTYEDWRRIGWLQSKETESNGHTDIEHRVRAVVGGRPVSLEQRLSTE